MRRIGYALKAELEDGGPNGRVYIDGLGLALAAHLVGRYASEAPAPQPAPAAQALSPRQARRVREHIEAHLDRDLSMADLASVAGLSLSHFRALFGRSFGAPPHRDSDPATGRLFPFDLAVARVGAGVAAAREAGLADFVLNARTDPFLRGFGDPAACLGEAVRRANAFAAAGAGSLFVPGPIDAETVRALTREIAVPVNILLRPGLAPLSEMAALGVRRISLGGGLAGAAYAFTQRLLTELKADGDFAFADQSMNHGAMMGLTRGFGGEP